MQYNKQEKGQGQDQGLFKRGYCKGKYMLVGMSSLQWRDY